jgi:hypothetical protein
MGVEFRMFGPGLDPAATLSVDGRAFGLRALSHWPGPPPPAPLSHDVTTGMALAYARKSEAERRELLGSFDVVTNDHYDTDGALSLFAILDPAAALPHEDLMIRAATTGDFRTWHGEDALAVDLTVWAARDAAGSPLRERLNAIDDYATAADLCYRWTFEQLPQVLADPYRWSSLWQRRFDRVVEERRRLLAGELRVERHEDLDLAVVHLQAPLTRHTVVAAAGDLYRILVVHESEQGFRYRFAYRNESWFLRLRDRTSPRLPLDEAVAALQRLEGNGGGGGWWCAPIDSTAAQLGFGAIEQQANVFGDFRTDLDPVSRLSPAVVIEALRQALVPELHPRGAQQSP